MNFTAPGNSAVVVSVENDPDHVFTYTPSRFNRIFLYNNSPNPFTNSTSIRFETEKPEYVRLTILDISGREVITLVDKYLHSGSHQITWDGLNVNHVRAGKGMYLYELTTSSGRMVKKMIME